MQNGHTLSLGQQADFHAAILKALPRDIDPAMVRLWINNGKSLTSALRETLFSDNSQLPKCSVWREVVLGTRGINIHEWIAWINSNQIEITVFDKLLLRDIELAEKTRTISLVIVSCGQLGLPHGGSYEEICKKAIALGFQLCPQETVLALCLNHVVLGTGKGPRDVPILMKPVKDSRARETIFCVTTGSKIGIESHATGARGRDDIFAVLLP